MVAQHASILCLKYYNVTVFDEACRWSVNKTWLDLPQKSQFHCTCMQLNENSNTNSFLGDLCEL